MSLAREKAHISSLIDALKESVNELEAAVQSDLILNAQLDSTNNLIRSTEQWLLHLDDDQYPLNKEKLQKELDRTQLILQCKDILVDMNEMIKKYKFLLAPLKMEKAALQELLKRCIEKNINNNDEELQTIQNEISILIDHAAIYFNNGFQDACDLAKDIGNLSVQSLETINVKRKKLKALTDSLPSDTAKMSDCINQTNNILNKTKEERQQKTALTVLKKTISDHFIAITAIIEKLQSDSKTLQALITQQETEFEYAVNFKILLDSISQYADENNSLYQAIEQPEFENTDIIDNHILVAQIKLQQNASRLQKTIDFYLTQARKRYGNEEKLIETDTIFDAQTLLLTDLKKLEEIIMVLELSLKNRQQCFCEAKLLDVNLKKFGIYQMECCNEAIDFSVFSALIEQTSSLSRNKNTDDIINISKSLIKIVKKSLDKLNDPKSTRHERSLQKSTLTSQKIELEKLLNEATIHINVINNQVVTYQKMTDQIKETLHHLAATLGNDIKEKQQKIQQEIVAVFKREEEKIIHRHHNNYDDATSSLALVKKKIHVAQENFRVKYSTESARITSQFARYKNTFSFKVLKLLSSCFSCITDKKKISFLNALDSLATIQETFQSQYEKLNNKILPPDDSVPTSIELKTLQTHQCRELNFLKDNMLFSSDVKKITSITQEVRTICYEYERQNTMLENEINELQKNKERMIIQGKAKLADEHARLHREFKFISQFNQIIASLKKTKESYPANKTPSKDKELTVASIFQRIMKSASNVFLSISSNDATLHEEAIIKNPINTLTM